MNYLFCVECGTKRINQHKFCGNCGKVFFNKAKENSIQSYKFTPNIQDIEIYKNHINYLNRVSSRASRIITALFICIFICFFSIIGTGVLGIFLFILCIITVIVVSGSGLHNDTAKATIGRNYIHKDQTLKSVYYTLESAKNCKNEPVCIFCGNKRFFRKGIYASNDCTVNCTKCQSYLYTE